MYVWIYLMSEVAWFYSTFLKCIEWLILSVIILIDFVQNVFWKSILWSCFKFSDILEALIPRKQQKENSSKNIDMISFAIFKLDLTVFEYHFLCLRHGPQNCMITATAVKKSPAYEFRQLVLGVCLWQSLSTSLGHFSNAQKHRIMIENLFPDDPGQTLFSEEKTIPKVRLQR